jgi:hypothetical protein
VLAIPEPVSVPVIAVAPLTPAVIPDVANESLLETSGVPETVVVVEPPFAPVAAVSDQVIVAVEKSTALDEGRSMQTTPSEMADIVHSVQTPVAVPPITPVIPPLDSVAAVSAAPTVAPVSPLRNKLASLLGRGSVPSAPAPHVAHAAPVVVASAAPEAFVAPAVVPPITPVIPPMAAAAVENEQKKPDADDADLYSINSFTI